MNNPADLPWIVLNWIVNVLLVGTMVAVVAAAAWSPDVADITPAWTAEGKALAVARAAWPVKDDMVTIPSGWFLMGSSRCARDVRTPETAR